MAAENKKLQAILFDLSGNDTVKKINAVKELKVYGNESAIVPMLNILLTGPDEELRKEVIETLNTVKHTAVPKVLIEALLNPDFKTLRLVILTSMWNSGLDYGDFIPEIVQAATEGDMMDALECITIIENHEGDLMEAPLLEGQLVLKEYLSLHKTESSQRIDLLRELDAMLQLRIDNN